MNLVTRALATDDFVVDLSAKVSQSEAQAFVSAGVTAVYRYVFFGSPRVGDLDEPELGMWLGLGVTVLCVVHVPYPGWVTSATLGQEHTAAAVANCIRAGYVTPSGQAPLALGCDMEGVGSGDALGYVVSSCDGRVANTYAPDLYVGYQSGLSAAGVQQIEASYATATFWCDFASMSQRPAPSRGFDAHQSPQSQLAGTNVDRDTILRAGCIYGLCNAG